MNLSHRHDLIRVVPDPVDLVKIVDVHVLHTNMVAVHSLQPLDDFSQRKGLLLPSNVGGFWQLKHCVQVLKSQII